jgi:transmembrane sensor
LYTIIATNTLTNVIFIKSTQSKYSGSAVSSISEITSLSDQAIEWVILLHSGNATEADQRQAQHWQNRSPVHQKAYREAEQLWQEMGQALQPSEIKSPPASSPKQKSSASQWLAAGWAVAIIICVLITPFSTFTDRWLSDYHTAVGEQKHITLSDGSRVILNTDTALAVEWNSSGRRIRLLRGQAQFTVARDPLRPFEVATDNAVIKALGTIFEVLDDEQNTRVTVLEHAVSIKAPQDKDYTGNTRIEAGQQARYSFSKGLETVVTVDLKKNSAWQRGKLIVKNQPLSIVVADLNRYNQGKFVMTNDKLSELHVSGAFPLDNPVAILAMLEQSLPLKIRHITPWLTLIQSL